MPSYSESVLIHASPEKVWSFISDLDTWTTWTPTVTKLERFDQDALKIGSRARLYQPKLRPAIWEITDWRPNQSFTWVSTAPGLKTIAEHALEPTDSGCRLTLRLHFQGPLGGVVGAFASSLSREYLRLEANGLKRHSEVTSDTVK